MRLSDLDPSQVNQSAQNVAANAAPLQAPPTQSLSNLSGDDISYLGDNEQDAKYGTLPQQALAGVEGLMRGRTLGLSDVLEQQLARMNPQLFGPEAVRGREEANPFTSTATNMVGGAGLIAATGGLSAPLEGLGLAPAAAHILGGAAEGSLFGASNVVSDAALGDPNLNAQKILAQIGLGAAIGGGLASVTGLASAMLRKAPAEATVGTPAGDVGDVIEPPTPSQGEKPTSLAEMNSRIDELKKFGGQEDINFLPQHQEAVDANSRIGDQLQLPMTDLQMDSLKSQAARNEFKIAAETPGYAGDTISNYQGAQKKNLVMLLDNSIKNLAPGYEPTADAALAGERASDLFTKTIQATRDELGPAFEAIKETPLNETDHLPGVIDYLTNPETSNYANPKIANMFDTGGETLEIKPYQTNMGIDKSTYSAIKAAVSSLQENPENFEQLISIRKGMSQSVDTSLLGDAAKEVGQAKAAMMDYIQDAVQSQEPDLAVRDTFKKWAINEENAQLIEKKFGAQIGDNFRSLAKGKPEEAIVGKIFKDSATTQAAKNILSPEDFNKLLADHLSILRNDVTDNGVFSSNKFFSKMKSGQYALNEAMDGSPEYQNIKDYMTMLRIFPDSAPINPSGTAKTLLGAMQKIMQDPTKILGTLAEYGKGKLVDILENQKINAKLAGIAESSNKLDSIQKLLGKVTSSIQSGAKSIVNSSSTRVGLTSLGSQLSDKEYDSITKQLGLYSSNPKSMMDDMGDQTQHMYQAAPNITQSMTTSLMQGIQFLNSKIPTPPTSMPLTPKWEPSKAQKNSFNQYYQGVNDPVGLFKKVKNGTLTNQNMEALQAVHPDLLNEMRSQTLQQMQKPENLRKLPYSQKLSLAKFLGQPLDENMVPQAVMSNQASMNAPNMSQQTSEAQARKGPKSTLGGLKQLDLAGRSATTTHREAQDE